MRACLIVLAAGACVLIARAEAATPFDGVYKGPMTLTKQGAGKSICAPGRDVTLTVSNGTLHFRWGDQTGDVAITPDGSFSGPVGVGFVTGKITGPRLEADASGRFCGYHFATAKG